MRPKIKRPAPTRPVAHEIGSDTLVEWRERRLRRAGFDLDQAAAVAREGAMDLHALIELIERGCSPDLAVRILAPLEQEPDQYLEPATRPVTADV